MTNIVKLPTPLPPLPLNVPHWQLFDKLESDADEVLGAWKECCSRNRETDEDAGAFLAGRGVGDALKRCKDGIAFFDRLLLAYIEDADDGDTTRLTIEAIGPRLGLMDDVLAGGKAVPGTYMRGLAEHVYKAEPTPYALETACRAAEGTRKFQPSPGEFLPLLAKAEALWVERQNAIRNVAWWLRKAGPSKGGSRVSRTIRETKLLALPPPAKASEPDAERKEDDAERWQREFRSVWGGPGDA